MHIEQQYTMKVEEAVIVGKLQAEKDEAETLCNDMYLKAMDAYEKFCELSRGNDRMAETTMVGDTYQRLLYGARDVVRKSLIDQGIEPSDGRIKWAAPALKPMPEDKSDLTQM